MSGDVGRACASRPGYMGYVPSGMVKVADLTTALNTKLPLEKRIEPAQKPLLDEAERTLDASRASAFQKRGCMSSVYTSSAGVYHGSPPRAVASIQTHAPYAGIQVPSGPTQYETTNKTMETGYASFSKQNVMSELRAKEQTANECAAPNKVTRSSARATLPSILIQAVRKDVAKDRPEISFAKTEKRSATLSVKGISETCPDVKMFAAAPLSTYQAELAKGREYLPKVKVFPGYQGHVPQTSVNLAKMQHDCALLANKSNVLASAPCRTMPGYGGHIPKATNNDRGSQGLKPTLADTTTGDKSSHVGLDEFSVGKMNTVLNGKSSAVRKFFTPGPYADNSISDQFYIRYRPYEGFMKGGPASSTQWISDKDLRTSVL